MKKIMLAIALGIVPAVAFAAGGGDHPLVVKYKQQLDVNLENMNSLRNGAKLFTNYCLSCHSAAYMRYNRMGMDLGLSDEQVTNNLMFVADFSNEDKPQGTAKNPGSLMTVAMQSKDAKKWFGTAVPDLTVIARARGAEWLYAYLNTFYRDDSRPVGVNNLTFPNVGMPHVLWDLQGIKEAKYETHTGKDGKERREIVALETAVEGSMTDAEYEKATNDLVNFLVYMGEPVQMKRQRTGIMVMFFLAVFFVFAYLLKKEYWKDVH